MGKVIVRVFVVEQVTSYIPVAQELEKTVERLQTAGWDIQNIFNTDLGAYNTLDSQGFVVIARRETNEDDNM